MALGLFLVLIIVILIMALKFTLDLRLEIVDTAVKYTVRLRLGSYFLAVPAKYVSSLGGRRSQKPIKNVDDALEHMQNLWHSLDYFVQEIQHFRLELSYGLGDPFWTALAYGSIWGVLGSFLNVLAGSKRLRKEPEILVQPNYNGSGVQVQLYCIFHFKLGQIIVKELKRLSYAWFA